MPCEVTNPDKNNYELLCKHKNSFEENLNQSGGDFRDILLNLHLYEDGINVFINANNEPQKNPIYCRKKASGLSGGDIAGIAISCVKGSKQKT